MNPQTHIPVLLNQSIAALSLKPGHIVVDATYGRGGHTAEIFKKIKPQGELVLLDRDASAIQHAKDHWGHCSNVHIVHCAFSTMDAVLKQRRLHGKVDAVLFDFGVCSPQLNEPERGFSFKDGPLDMRMNREQELDASMWIKQVEEQELVRVLKTYGEERFARRIARAIKDALIVERDLTTAELAKLVVAAIPFPDKHKHPATRTFQAIRIAVNDELGEIEKALPQALDCLVEGGRLVMISFHSLEDRLVKRFIREQAKGDPWPVDLPVTADMLSPRLRAIGKAIRADNEEIERNPRARSAVMRAAEKLNGGRV